MGPAIGSVFGLGFGRLDFATSVFGFDLGSLDWIMDDSVFEFGMTTTGELCFLDWITCDLVFGNWDQVKLILFWIQLRSSVH